MNAASADAASAPLPETTSDVAEITDTTEGDDEESIDLVKSLTSTQYRIVIHSVLTVLSSTLPVLPIVILYLVKDQAARVGLVFAFTMILAGVITFGLNMKAEKVIAITTA